MAGLSSGPVTSPGGTTLVVIAPPNSGFQQTITALNAVTATKVPATPLSARVSIVVINTDASITIYVGNSGVTALNGIPVGPGDSLPIGVGPGVDVYAIAASGTPNAATLELA